MSWTNVLMHFPDLDSYLLHECRFSPILLKKVARLPCPLNFLRSSVRPYIQYLKFGSLLDPRLREGPMNSVSSVRPSVRPSVRTYVRTFNISRLAH